MPKQGFKNQWIPISQIGKFADSTGVERDLNESFLKEVIANFTPNDAPAVVGHPKDNAPAFGWATALRLQDGVLEAQFADTDDEFERMVKDGKFRKRSASFYMNPARLRHVGFLGAQPPAIKGLRDIQFNDGDSVTVEISFSEEQIMKDEEVEKVADSFVDKLKNLFKSDETTPSVVPPTQAPAANFSAADAQQLIDAAVAKAKAEAKAEAVAEFTETIKTLQDSVNATSASGKRAEIMSFVEAIPAEKGKHFLKRAGIVEFMESLADDDKADAISFSEGDTEYKFSRLDWFKNYINAQQSFVEFGEKFGTITATAEADVIVDPNSLNELRGGMGVESKTGGEK